MNERLRIVTYNIHSCRGTDGTTSVQRVANVIEALRPDIVALQEVDRGSKRAQGCDQATMIAERIGMKAHFTATRSEDVGEYGIATLFRHPFSVSAEGYLPKRNTGEPRVAHWLKVRTERFELDVVNTHLSIHFRERLLQVRALLSPADGRSYDAALPLFPALPRSASRLVLCGDFNAGVLSAEYRYLRSKLNDAQRAVRRWPKPTFPSRFPVLRLDHIWVGDQIGVHSAEVDTGALARRASDHLPLVAELKPFANQPLVTPQPRKAYVQPNC